MRSSSIASDQGFRRGIPGAFRPGWLPGVLVLLLFPCLIALGFWQLARAEEKRELLAAHQAQQVATPISIERWSSSQPGLQACAVAGLLRCAAYPAAGQPAPVTARSVWRCCSLSMSGQRPLAAAQSRLATLARPAYCANLYRPRIHRCVCRPRCMCRWVKTFQLQGAEPSMDWPRLISGSSRMPAGSNWGAGAGL